MILETDYPIPCPKCNKLTFEYDYAENRRTCVNPYCNYVEETEAGRLTRMERFWKWLLEE